MDSVEQTIASQYANSPTLAQMIDSMNQFFDPSADFDAFYDYVWNVDTAQGFGLDIWGRIVGVVRTLTVPNTELIAFGFKEGDAPSFGEGAAFYAGGVNTTTYTLDDYSFRQLIFAKAFSNISNCSAASINQQLQNLFPGRGRAYVNDYRDMTMRFTFEFELEPFELAILLQSGAPTRPAGVDSVILQIDRSNLFGFAEGGGQTFGNGVFYNQ